MKFSTCLAYGPGDFFSYGATGSTTCVKVGSHFSKWRPIRTGDMGNFNY